MNKKPFFSVMIPVYNVENYLDECMRSVIEQTFSDYEIILIDDGSTDCSGVICDRYCKMYGDFIKVIHKENQGLFAARRTGINLACGEFGIFLDSDDYLELNCLENIHRLIEKHSGAKVILYNIAYKYEETGEIIEGKRLFPEEMIFESNNKKKLYEEMISSYSLNNLVLKCIDLKILKSDSTDYSKYYSNSHGEDLIQSLYPITNAEKIVYTGQVFYNYRINVRSMTSKVDLKAFEKQNSTNGFYEVMRYMAIWDMTDEDCFNRLYTKRYIRLTTNFWKCFLTLTCRKDKLKLIRLIKTYFHEMGNEHFWRNKYLPHMRKLMVLLIKYKMLTILDIMCYVKRVKDLRK